MNSIHDPRYVAMINHLKKVRKNLKVNQETLGERMGWNQQDISRVESFVRRLDFIELCDWLDALGYSVENFMREIGKIE
jgi:transcriptional regulator with XRE-family HTH domain